MPDRLAPYGYCHCGCGQKTKPVNMTSRARGVVKGEPCRYVAGHNRRDRGNYVIDENGCWLWQGTLTGSGYGPHRRYYERHYGPIPDGLTIDHLCRVRTCVNPRHLEAVSMAENNRRALAKLSPEDIAAIRATVPHYGYRVVLAERYGVSVDTIGSVRSGQTWN